jgi:transmembrane sensor
VKIIDIHRYLSDEASAEEKRKLERWLEASEENRKNFESFRDIYNVELGYRFHFDKEAALVKFRKVMEGDSHSLKSIPIKKYSEPRKHSTGIWLKVAAVFIAVIGISIYVAISTDFTSDDRIVESVSGTTITTEPGEQKSFRLRDGSRIRLNASSEIYIPAGYGTVSRELTLKGEGYFEVESGHEFDFTVTTSSARISVLGTSFAVRAWAERDESVIAVETGRVNVRSSNPEIEEATILNAGQYAQVALDEAPGPAIQGNIERFTGWTNQMFVFDETPLRDVLRELELHFNVEIKVKDSVSIDDPVTAKYTNESLEEILRYTSITHEVEFETQFLNNNNQ